MGSFSAVRRNHASGARRTPPRGRRRQRGVEACGARDQGRDGVGDEDEEGEEVGVGRQRGDGPVDHPPTGGGRLQQAGEGEGGQGRDEGGHRVAAELLAPLEGEAVEGVGHGGDRAHPLVDQAAPEDEEQGHGAHPEPEGQEAEERLAVAEPDPSRGQEVERGLVDFPVGDPPEGVADGAVDGADRLALVVPEPDPIEVAQTGEEGDDCRSGGGQGGTRPRGAPQVGRWVLQVGLVHACSLRWWGRSLVIGRR